MLFQSQLRVLMRGIFCCVFLAIVVASVNPVVGQDGYGSVAGQVVFGGTIPQPRIIARQGSGPVPEEPTEDVFDESLLINSKSRGVANVFAWPVKVPSIHPRFDEREPQSTRMTFDGRRVEPRCLLLETGQELTFRANPGTTATAYLRTLFNQGWHVAVPGNKKEGVSLPPFQRQEQHPIRLTSNLQPWLEGWIKLSDHPYAALSDHDGRFQINWLPAGNYEFMVWHEKAGYLARRLPVTVRDRKITRIDELTITLKDTDIQQR